MQAQAAGYWRCLLSIRRAAAVPPLPRLAKHSEANSVKVKRIGNHELPLPKQETLGSAGYDLRTTEAVTIWPGQRKMVGTGFAWALPEGFMGIIRPRSGTANQHGLHILGGLLDNDYRGELKAILINLGNRPVSFAKGDRVAQMVVTMCYQQRVVEVDDLDETERGAGSFGHTGLS